MWLRVASPLHEIQHSLHDFCIGAVELHKDPASRALLRGFDASLES
jgi:hypothetical protein